MMSDANKEPAKMSAQQLLRRYEALLIKARTQRLSPEEKTELQALLSLPMKVLQEAVDA